MERIGDFFSDYKAIVAGLLFLVSVLALLPVLLLTFLGFVFDDCGCMTNSESFVVMLPLLITLAILAASLAYLLKRSSWLWHLCATAGTLLLISPLAFLLYYAWWPPN
jgi:hypothetical protein